MKNKDIQKLKFVDENFNKLSSKAPKEQRYAIDLGVRTMFAFQWLAGGPPKHYYVSATPLGHNMTRKQAFGLRDKLKELNPDAVFTLLDEDQVRLLNTLAVKDKIDFYISDCWTDSISSDWHGRADGFISFKKFCKYVDHGENKTSVYIAFGFKRGKQKKIILPEN